MQRIAIIGGGRIGEALLAGLLSAGWSDIVVTSRRPERVAELAERHGVDATTSNGEAVRGAAIVVIAVKPQDIDALLDDIGSTISPEQTVITVAAAIPTARIEAKLADGVPVVRAMPNSPSTVHEGMAGIAPGAHAGDPQLAVAEDVLSHLGRVVRVAEHEMDAGILLGLSREISTTLVVQTMLGTAKQLRDQGMHPVELRESVTSPGGTTIAAIRELEQAGVRAAFLNAIQAAMDRARELADPE